MKPTLHKLYEEQLIADLQKEGGYKNVNEVPYLEKIVVNSHVGHYVNERKAAVEDAVAEVSKITGQKPAVVFARKSVANFKVREGEQVGARVTLRGARMWEFLDRFIHITCPNIRDFRGLPFKSFDGSGNYAVGFPDQSIFPEVELDQIKRQIGFDFIFVTSSKSDAGARALLKALGMPFRDKAKAESAA